MSRENIRYYGVRLVKKDLPIQVTGMPQTLPLQWADGMVGAIPIFDSFIDALKYAGDDEDLVFRMYGVEDEIQMMEGTRKEDDALDLGGDK